MNERANINEVVAARCGDKEALEHLIVENSGLIWSVARRFFGCGVEPDDLYQLGCVGFLKAVAAFDTSYGTQFSTYAVPKISGEIRRFLRDDGSIKVSRNIKDRARAIKTAQSSLEQKLGREPTVSEISVETGISIEDISVAETATSAAQSLQHVVGEDGFTLESVLGDYGQEEKIIEYVALREAISSLSEKEQMVVKLRFYHAMTQEQTAKVLGVSQVQVSRLERRAIENLRKML